MSWGATPLVPRGPHRLSPAPYSPTFSGQHGDEWHRGSLSNAKGIKPKDRECHCEEFRWQLEDLDGDRSLDLSGSPGHITMEMCNSLHNRQHDVMPPGFVHHLGPYNLILLFCYA